MTPDHYATLGVARPASAEQVRRAYRRAARAAHPDRGGTVERFLAVQEAHRVLSDPELRDAYHRELDGVGPSWDDVAWGNDPDAARPAAERRSTSDAHADPGDGSTSSEVDLDPFGGGPRELPDPLATEALGPPQLPPPWRETFASVVALALAALAAVLLAVAAVQVPVPDQHPLSEFSAVVLFGGGAVALNTLRTDRNHPGVWLLTAVGLASALALLGDAAVPSGLRIAASIAGAAGIVTGVVWARAFGHRRSDPRLLAALALKEPGARVERHRRAAAWNQVRRALEDPAAIVVLLGWPAVDASGQWLPDLRWTYDPVAATHVVRAVDPGLPPASWAVLDRHGTVLATAPHGAPEAWFEILSEGRGERP